MKQLDDKICVVTGAAAGIGYATARAFAAEGAEVIALDRDAKGLARLVEASPAVRPEALDITDAAAVKAFYADLSRVDVLFNCAGKVAVGDLGACGEEDWQTTLDLNVTAIFRLSREALPLMLAAGGGSIINMASVISSIGAAPERFAYGVSKAAVIGMTKSIALDFADRGIRCNAICPSAVETPSMTARIEAMEDPETARAAFSSRQPVGRMATPAEIAALAVYLAGDGARYTTGSAIVIDGGASL